MGNLVSVVKCSTNNRWIGMARYFLKVGDWHLRFIACRRRLIASRWRFDMLVLAPLLLVASFQSIAQQDTASDAPKITVSNFLIDGDNPIGAAKSERILAPFLNIPLDISQLRTAASELEKLLAVAGFNFYRADLPPQTLRDGVVRIKIDRLGLADVTVIGNEFFSSDNIKRSLPLVASGKSPNTKDIANALLLADDNPSKDVRVIFVKGSQPQTIDANISVKDKNPNEFFLWANNAGSRLTSESRVGIQYHNRNLFDRDHQLALSYTISPEDTSELSQFGINYKFPLFSLRGMANLFYSKSDADTGRVADVFDVSGAGETYGMGYTQYLNRHNDYQHRLAVNLVDKLYDSDILFQSANIGEDVRSRPLSIEYTSTWDISNWLLNTVVSHSSNLSGGNFNDDQTYSRVRAGADADWNKQNLSARFDYRWSRDWRSRVLFFAQVASQELIPGEQFGLGGSLGDPGPRGFYEREVSVDEGVKGSIELNRNFPTKNMQLGVFFDFASGDMTNPQVGESPKETLSSVGISYKWNVRPDLSFDAEYGYVLNGIDQTFTPGGTDDSDSRLHLSLRYYPEWRWGNKL